MTTEPVNTQGITRRAILAAASAVVFFCLLFFAPAGTFAYWQAWAYMGVVLIPMLLQRSPGRWPRWGRPPYTSSSPTGSSTR